MRIRLVTTQLASASLKQLAVGLSTKLGYKVWRSRVPRQGKRNIQYGDCKDKIFQYKWYEVNQIPALEYTTEQSKAQEWASGGSCVVARLLTRASEGKGIVITEAGGQVPVAPVYTKYKKKKQEFRVHVFQGKVVHVLEKRKKTGTENFSKVRNLANGYVFCSDSVIEPNGLRDLALRAAKVTSSDFAGVDIGYNEKKDELFVIEVNSAPGIQGSNLTRYIDVITQS